MHLEVICTFWIGTTRGTEYADSYAKKKNGICLSMHGAALRTSFTAWSLDPRATCVWHSDIADDLVQGYAQDHQDIELLRLRNFTLGKKLPDHDIVGAGGLGRIAEIIACMVPFVSLTPYVVPRIRRYIQTDRYATP
jgi:hypothetical protein